MQPFLAEELEHETAVELLERDFRAWLETECAGPRCETLERTWECALLAPARGFLERPGKQFRARLVRAAFGLAGGDACGPPAELPLLIEILHAGSLIVDDVQDGSLRRRGAPALHLVVGVPLAINTGNLLYYWMLARLARLGLAPERELELTRRTASAMLRCHQGQALDLSSRACDLPQYVLPQLVLSSTRLKAGALMELAAAFGAVAAGAPEERAAALCDFGGALGLALQMLDDLSGVLDARRREKAREDLRLARPTWIWAWLARDLAEGEFGALQAHARRVAEGCDPDALIDELARRFGRNGCERVRRHSAQALDGLRRVLGPSAHLAALEQEIERLEASYV
jgi:geranylgeranyl pyrophosphate synthase